MKLNLIFSAFAAAIVLAGCQSRHKIVSVRDADTGYPVSGAFVYAASSDSPDPFAGCALLRTNENGKVSIDGYHSGLFILAGKEGYDVARSSEWAGEIERGGIVETEIKLKKEGKHSCRLAKVEFFRPFPDDAESAAIAEEMSDYFGRRNTIVCTYGEPAVIDAKIVVRDRKTKKPVSNAMVLVQQRTSAFEVDDFITTTDSSGVAAVPLELFYSSLTIDAGKEGYYPSKRFRKNPYKHGVYEVEIGVKPKSSNYIVVVSDTSEFSKRKTDIPLWERFKEYCKKVGVPIKYKSETR